MYELNYGVLLPQMRRAAGSIVRLATMLGIADKTVSDWLSKASSGELRLKHDQRETIFRVARELDLEPVLFSKGPMLWNPAEGYGENVTRHPGLAPEFHFVEQGKRWPFIGYNLNSPFGASASVLTSTASRIRFLAHSGADILTYKTVRSTKYKAHPMPNIMYCSGEVQPIDPDGRAPQFVMVDDTFDTSNPLNGMMNRFGMPSLVPELWQEDFRAAMRSMLPGQLLILSVVGTAGQDEDPDVLIRDFVRVAEMGVEAGAEVLEINGSCPNCSGMEGTLCQNVGILATVVENVRRAVKSLPIILKIGFTRPKELKELVYRTADHVSAYAAINTFPVEGKRQGNYEPEPAFGKAKLKAGLSGAPIQQLALRTIRELRHMRDGDKSMQFGIVGIGGIIKPSDVSLYLSAGADVVQATTVFFSDSLFAAKVRQHLSTENVAVDKTISKQRRGGLNNMLIALDELEQEFQENPTVTLHLQEAAIRVFTEWSHERASALELSQYRGLQSGSVPDFKRRLRSALMPS